MIFLLLGNALSAQQDSRYDSDKNLPFNRKAGDVDPQTGNVTIQETDLTLPGRAGMDFSFGRIWKTNQSNVFAMSRDPLDGNNRLTGRTIEEANHLGAGWSTNLPCILTDDDSGSRVISLFFDGGTYEIDQTGVKVRNLNKSNLLWYDLLDRRIYEDSSKSYGDSAVDVIELSSYGVADRISERNRYELILKDNSRYFFRSDGKLMARTDRTGLNEIWYYYDSQDRLAAAVDTVGRIIGFSYDSDFNLGKIEWDVMSHEIDGDGRRITVTQTRSITYGYKPASEYTAVSSLTALVTDYKPSYALTSVTDAMGHIKEYEYTAGNAAFSFESNLSHWRNAYLLLTGIRNFVKESGEALSVKRYEYEVPAGGMFTRYFRDGYMEYFKVSRQWNVDREGRETGNTLYLYRGNNEAGNFNCYTALVLKGGITQTFRYSISSDPARNDVLDSLTTESSDGYLELVDYVYNRDRVKIYEETFRQGQFAYSEKFLYDLKGNLKEHTDRIGLRTVKQYDEIYSLPIGESRLFTSAGEEKEYELERTLTSYGQIEKEILYIDKGGAARGLVTRYDYDPYGNLSSITDPAGEKVFTLYDGLTQALPVRTYRIVTEEGYLNPGVPDYWFSRPDDSSQVNLNSWRVFNSDGSLWLEVDAGGFAVEHYYDALGSETATVHPDEDDVLLDGEEVNDIRAHSSFSSFLSRRLHNPGVRREIDYEKGFVKTLTDFEYDSTSRSWSTVATGLQHDGTGNITEEITYGEGGSIYAVKTMVYDLYGHMIALTDPDAGSDFSSILTGGAEVARYDKTWLVRYDDLGRTVKVLYPDTAGRSAIKRISYNDAGNSVTTTDPEGSVVYEKKDWNGNVTERIAYGDSSAELSETQVYSFEYDALNRMTGSVDPGGLVTGYRYDERDLLTEQIYGSGSDFMVYNERGLLTSRTDRKGQLITYTYDEAGRNIKTEYFRAGETAPDDREYRLYDSRGYVTRVENNDLIEQCEFDGAGRLSVLNRRLKDKGYRTAVSSIYGGSEEDQVFSFAYGYRAGGLLNEMTFPDGSVHNFTYGPYLGQLKEINEGTDGTSISPFVTDLEYNRSGVVTEMAYANGTRQLWDFDNRKRISRIRIGLTSAPNEYWEDLNFTIDGAGNITGINENRYGYDGFHRLVSAGTKLPDIEDRRTLVKAHFGTYAGGEPVDGKVYDGTADLFPEKMPDGRVNGGDYLQALIELDELTSDGKLTFDRESFSYDRKGNRTELNQNGDVYFYRYGERNRLERIEVTGKEDSSRTLFAEYTYDGNGNRTSATLYGAEETRSVEFEYDVQNRLVKTTGGSGVTEYLYDTGGNRVVKSSSDGSMTLYLRHGSIAVAMDIEVNGDQAEEKGRLNRYVLSGDLLAGRVTTTVDADDSLRTEKNFYHLDHLNSTKIVTDEDGEVVVNYSYRAFGEPLKKLDAEKNATENRAKYSWSGKELDEDINLYYFNARFYDAVTGRFINADPAQDGLNWYVYANNNPLNRVDPTGLSDIYASDTNGAPIVSYFGRDIKAETEIVIQRNNDDSFYNDSLKLKIGNQTLFNAPVQSEADIEEPRLTDEYNGSTLLAGKYSGTLLDSSYSYDNAIKLFDNYLIHPDRFTTDQKIADRIAEGKSIGPWSQPYSAGCQIMHLTDFNTLIEELHGIGLKSNNRESVPVEIRAEKELY